MAFPALLLTVVGCGPSYRNASIDSRPAVVGGKQILRIGEYPASRSLMIFETVRNGQPTGFCTAVLIAPNIGLTSAHCFDQTNPEFSGFRVTFATQRYSSGYFTRTGVSYRVHPQYRSEKIAYTFDFGNGQSKAVTMDRRYDLAIFSFAGTLPAGAVPAKIYQQQDNLSNKKVFIYGAGHSRYITSDEYNSRTHDDGSFGWLRRGEGIIHHNYLELYDLYFVAPGSLSQTCRGDSGGPQFLSEAKSPTVVGLNSAMIVNDLDGKNVNSMCGHTAVVTKVAPFKDWISTQAALLSAELK